MKHFNAKETYDSNPYIHKHVDLWVEDSEFSEFVQTINEGTEGQVPTKQNDGTVKWEDGGGSSNIFLAEYEETSLVDVQSAISAGKLVFLKYTDGALIPCAGDYDFFVQFRGSVADSMKLITVTDTGWSMESDDSIQTPINQIILG